MFSQLFYEIKRLSFTGVDPGSRGGVLIGAVVTMVIMGFLGAGMVALLGSSVYHEVRAKNGEQAYYLAESGFRYAASYYAQKSMSDLMEDFGVPEDETESETTTIAVPEGGSFGLSFKRRDGVTHNVSGGDLSVERGETITLADSTGLVDRYGFFEHENSRYRYFSKSVVGDTHTITGITGDTIKRRVDVVNLDADGDLESILLQDGIAIPLSSGNFRYKNKTYAYGSYSGGALHTITTVNGDLVELADASNGDVLTVLAEFPIVLSSGESIDFVPMLEVFSRGNYGSGFFGVTRKVTYAWPVFEGAFGGAGGGEPVFDPGDEIYGLEDPWDVDDWTTGPGTSGEGDVVGDYRVTQIDGSDAFWVYSMNPSGVAMPSTLVMYSADPITSPAYQVQIKVKLGDDLCPKYYAAGITFRKVTDSLTPGNPNVKSYGISFVRGEGGRFSDIPNALVPTDNAPYLVLWRYDSNPNNPNPTTRLAYASLSDSTVIKTANDPNTPCDETGALQDWSTVLVRVEQIGEGETAYNRIMVMYSDHDGDSDYDDGDNNPLNIHPNRISSPRNGIVYHDDTTDTVRLPWPTNTLGEWTQYRDYFTVVEWNPTTGGNATRAYESVLGEDKYVYIHTQPGENLFSPPEEGQTVSLEVGLHSWGHNMDGYLYFDDLGILQAAPAEGGVYYIDPMEYS